MSKFICPIHGIVEAKPNEKTKRTITQKGKDIEKEFDNYICSVDGCTIQRTKSEMEFP